MQKLIRKNGKLCLVKTDDTGELVPTAETKSPIVTTDNQPKSLKPAKPVMPKKSELLNLMTKEQLLTAMQKADAEGKTLTTHMFALLIAPMASKKTDPEGHHRWDICHCHIRQLARQLEKDGKLRLVKQGRVYQYILT
jgi:hypothetical protein